MESNMFITCNLVHHADLSATRSVYQGSIWLDHVCEIVIKLCEALMFALGISLFYSYCSRSSRR